MRPQRTCREGLAGRPLLSREMPPGATAFLAAAVPAATPELAAPARERL